MKVLRKRLCHSSDLQPWAVNPPPETPTPAPGSEAGHPPPALCYQGTDWTAQAIACNELTAIAVNFFRQAADCNQIQAWNLRRMRLCQPRISQIPGLDLGHTRHIVRDVLCAFGRSPHRSVLPLPRAFLLRRSTRIPAPSTPILNPPALRG